MRYWKVIIGGFVLISLYTLFWFWFFGPPSNKNISTHPRSAIVYNNKSVLGLQSPKQEINPNPTQTNLQASYQLSIDNRQQFFNLSCEFAAASGIIFNFTNNPDFSVANEKEGEKELINKMWISRNPNVGIRMGQENVTSLDSVYTNLNKWFGGSDYYGIHAPPFIDLFANYQLTAKPIYINDSTISLIKEALSKDHLVMAWIKIGYAQSVDDYLSYGKVKIVRGEHSVIIIGYDQDGVIIMDPGIGLKRYIEYQSLLDASSPFPMPFLEVYKNIENKIPFNNLTVGFDTLTGIDRSIPKIHVENGAGRVGTASQMRDILKDFGYNVNALSNADNFDYEDVTIKAKKDFSDFLYILNRDIKLAGYAIAASSSDLLDKSEEDVVVIVGK